MLRRAEQLIFPSNYMVPTAGLEPAQVAPLAPQTSASTNFATSAIFTFVQVRAVSAAMPVRSQVAAAAWV
jgi:hypothetical protein